MEIVENTLNMELHQFLSRPLFAHVATDSEHGPRSSPLWFLWEEQAIWFSVNPSWHTIPDRIEREPQCALSIVDADPSTGRVQHVGMRGQATIEPFDANRQRRRFRKYLGRDEDAWPEQFKNVFNHPEKYVFVRFTPDTVVARDQSYPAPPG
jgi:nitroimidazol reductase NimA-like FMN-containing flavoprotein (pyridoxamine 5'-phosphate oxidase superfamily)